MAKEKPKVIKEIEDREKDVELYVINLEKFLSKNLKSVLSDLEKKEFTPKEAGEALGGLVSLLKRAGLSDKLEVVHDIYAEELLTLQDELLGFVGGARLNAADIDVAEALVTFDTERIEAEVLSYVTDLRSGTMRAVIAGSPERILDLEEKLSGRLLGNLKTEINTAVSAFNQTLTQKKAQELGIDLFVYLGPLDDITRPFCRARVDKVYSMAEIAKMDNGQDLDPFIYRGGYNCRHQWRPVSEDLAREEFGYKG